MHKRDISSLTIPSKFWRNYKGLVIFDLIFCVFEAVVLQIDEKTSVTTFNNGYINVAHHSQKRVHLTLNIRKIAKIWKIRVKHYLQVE